MTRILCAIVAAFIIMPGCWWSRAPVRSALQTTQEAYEKLPGTAVIRDPEHNIELTQAKLTLDDAVAFAITHNPGLQAFLENLGVAQANLHEAGLYSNPDADLAVRTSEGSSGHNVEFETLASISDLWQVPLRHNMAENEYQAMQHAVIARVLDTALETKRAYIACLYTQEDRKLVHTIYQDAQKLRDQIYTRYEHGYHNDIDLHLADTTVDRWYMAYKRAQAAEDEAHTQFETILGVATDATKDIAFDHTFMINDISLPDDRDTLIEQAYLHRPEIQELEKRIAQYHGQIRFEQSRVFPRVDFGASFEQELSGKHLRGPALSLEVPIFNANQAAISRAEYLKRRTQKELESMRTGISSEVALPYRELQALQPILSTYQESTLTSLQGAQAYAEYYTHQKRLTIPTLLQTQLFLHETQREYLATIRDIWHQIFRLERAVGMEVRNTVLSR